MEKVCNKCNQSKSVDDFHKKKSSPDGYRNQCKICVEEYMKEYRKEHKNDRADYDKKRYEENREEILEHKKEYHKKNQDKILAKKKEYRAVPENRKRMIDYLVTYQDENKEELQQKRKNNRPKFNEYMQKYRIEHKHEIAWRSLLHSTLKRLGKIKEGHTIDLLGYSALELKSHLESLFTVGMNWTNHGKWHIDHIIPVTYFNKNTPASVVCALSNLQPLWATTRQIDGEFFEGNLNKNSNM